MPKFLTDEWFREHLKRGSQLPEVPGVSLKTVFVLTDAPDGEFRLHEQMSDGRVAAFGAGEIEDPDIVVTLRYDDFRDVLRGLVSEEEVMARGKIEGNVERMMATQAVQQSQPYQDMEAALRRTTTY